MVDSISFVDSTWLGRGGLFHSGDMRIVEKFTRTGNEILHEMTIHDPESFVEPWVVPARTLTSRQRERTYCGACALRDLRKERHHHSVATLTRESPQREGR